MRLRTRFRITTAASLLAILLVVAVVAWQVLETDRMDRQVDVTRSLVKAFHERGMMRDGYLISRTDRARTQWEERTAELPGLLAVARASSTGPEERDLLAQITDLFERSTRLFREVAGRAAAPAPAGSDPTAADLQRRSIVALRILAYDLYARARELESLAARRLDDTLRQSTVALVILLVVVVAVTLVNSWLASLALQRRVEPLRQGAERIAAGNLDHRIRARGDDELAELGRSFDVMAEKLQGSYAALEASNRELEAFSYAVSHDLRAPLRSVAGFSQAVLEDYGPRLDDTGRQYLSLAAGAAREMGQLIDDLLGLSRVGRAEMARQPVDLSALARSILDELQRDEPERRVEAAIAPGLIAEGDPTLLRLVMENLLRNAWKFTSQHLAARIRVGREPTPAGSAFFVADDGAGFDMAYADKLFHPFQRLHRASEFTGTGIGLATVRRIARRHGGDAWAEGAIEKGATIHFTLPSREETHAGQDHPAG